MKSVYLFAVPWMLAICVSAVYGQDTTTTEDDAAMAKAAKMLHGVWAGDREKTRDEMKKAEDLELDEDMIEMMLEQIDSIKCEFKDGRFDVSFGDVEISGEWKVTKVKQEDDATVLTIHTSPDDDSEHEEKNFDVHFIGKTHMKMVDLDGGPPLVMKRKEADKKDD
jgi:hypothetical protein